VIAVGGLAGVLGNLDVDRLERLGCVLYERRETEPNEISPLKIEGRPATSTAPRRPSLRRGAIEIGEHNRRSLGD
jgi:hypothetical protein